MNSVCMALWCILVPSPFSLLTISTIYHLAILFIFLTNITVPSDDSQVHPRGFWVSGNDLRVEGQWVWGFTAKPVTIWTPRNGNMDRTSNCLMLSTDLTNYQDFRWLESSCNRQLYYVCEMSMEALYQGEKLIIIIKMEGQRLQLALVCIHQGNNRQFVISVNCIYLN